MVRKGSRRVSRKTRSRRHSSRRHRRSQRKTHRRMYRGGSYATTNDYKSGTFNRASDQLLMSKNPSTYEQALNAANTLVPGVNTVQMGGRRMRRTRRHSRRRIHMRGGSNPIAADCPTWHGAGGPCIPQPVAYNGPYGAIPIHQTAGLYPKQV
jgi:hypothetical protein